MEKDIENENKYLVCLRVKEGYVPPTLSWKERCCVCAVEVWRSASSPGEASTICIDCVIKKFKEEKEVEIAAPTAKQLNDIEKYRSQKKN